MLLHVSLCYSLTSFSLLIFSFLLILLCLFLFFLLFSAEEDEEEEEGGSGARIGLISARFNERKLDTLYRTEIKNSNSLRCGLGDGVPARSVKEY